MIREGFDPYMKSCLTPKDCELHAMSGESTYVQCDHVPPSASTKLQDAPHRLDFGPVRGPSHGVSYPSNPLI